MAAPDSDPAGVPLIEDLSDGPAARTSNSSKRKRDATDGDVDRKKAAKKARRKLKKPTDVDDDALDSELGINRAIAHMHGSLLADHMAQRTKRFQPDLSLVEADDWRIPERAISDTTSFVEPRVTDNLAPFLQQFAGPRRTTPGRTLAHAPPAPGAPHTLVVAGAGLRAADLTRALRTFQTKDAMVAKLFAKHIKLAEAVETCRKTRMNIGVGTPQRIMDLLDAGALDVRSLERIVVDASHIDQKKRGLLDMKDVQLPLVKLLTKPALKERYGTGEGQVQLLFY